MLRNNLGSSLLRRASRRGLATATPGLELLHESRIPTLHFQDSLPKLPVPKLHDSMRRLLYFAEPLLSKAELEETWRLAADFEYGGEGERLQELLVARDARRYSSFISEPWFDMYLSDRAPLLLNYNPQLTFRDEDSSGPGGLGLGPQTQVDRAARLIHASMTFMRTLESGKLEPDVFHTDPKRSKTPTWPEVMRMLPRGIAFYGAAVTGAYPLDMSQYGNLFRSTRLPGATRDSLQTYAGSRHVMVQRGGAFYELMVLDGEGKTLPLPQLRAGLQAIVDADGADAAAVAPDEAVGLLTSLPRDEWAVQRAALAAASEANAAALHSIDSAIFAVSLGAKSPVSLHDACREMLHGDGADRWLDKSFQLLVQANGKAAVNFEHAWGDGVAVLRYFNEVFDASTALRNSGGGGGGGRGGGGVPRRLSFDLPASVKSAVRDAKKRFDATIGSTELAVLESDLFTSGLLKRHKVSPDGMLQMSFQLAHHRMHGYSAATYESASTAAFKHGRTETIRSATPESHAFAAAFCDGGGGSGGGGAKSTTTKVASSPSEKVALMRKAAANHSRITRDALTGNGMDRHLFALRKLSEEGGKPAHPLFSGAACTKLGKIILSTSTLSSDALDNGGFGPVNDECYAIGYGIRNEGCRAQVMSYGRDSQGFIDNLEKAMKDMRAALEADASS